MMSPGQNPTQNHVRMEEETRHACSRSDKVRNYGGRSFTSLCLSTSPMAGFRIGGTRGAFSESLNGLSRYDEDEGKKDEKIRKDAEMQLIGPTKCDDIRHRRVRSPTVRGLP